MKTAPSIQTRQQNKILISLDPSNISPSKFFLCLSCRCYINWKKHNDFVKFHTDRRNMNYSWMAHFLPQVKETVCVFCRSPHMVDEAIKRQLNDCVNTYNRQKFLNNSFSSNCGYEPPKIDITSYNNFKISLDYIYLMFEPTIYRFSIEGKSYIEYPPHFWLNSNEYYSSHELYSELYDELMQKSRNLQMEIYDENDDHIHGFEI